jgi:hypothetical protein
MRSGDNGVGFNYSLTEKNLLPFYLEVIQNGTLQVLVYNGDTDPGINSFITQDRYTQYFDSMKLPLTETWRPWTLDGNIAMGGYVFRYASTFRFVTIRGSGHMVFRTLPCPAPGAGGDRVVVCACGGARVQAAGCRRAAGRLPGPPRPSHPQHLCASLRPARRSVASQAHNQFTLP